MKTLPQKFFLAGLAVVSIALLTSCGGGGGGSGNGPVTGATGVPTAAPTAFVANPWPRNTVRIMSPASGSGAIINNLSSDNAGGWIIKYRLFGRNGTIHLTSGDVIGPNRYQKELFDGDLFVTLELEDLETSTEFEVFDSFVNYDGSIYTGYYIYGTPTPSASLPSGSATYQGTFTGERQWIGGIASNPVNQHPLSVNLRGSAKLTFNFQDETIVGTLDEFEVAQPFSSFDTLLDSSITISGGKLSGSRFVANVSGVGQLSSYDGKLDGALYGSSATDVGAILSATGGQNDVLLGYITAKRDSAETDDPLPPNPSGSVEESDLIAALAKNSNLLLDGAGNVAYATPSFGSVTLSGGNMTPRGYVSDVGSVLTS